MEFVESIEHLEAIYGLPAETAAVKVANQLTDEYRSMIELSPFAVLATSGPEGLDCSPRGDNPGFVRILDPKTLLMPDRRGNNRIDSLRNIVRDPRASLLFFLPGCGNTLRVNGHAQIRIDESIRASFAVEDKLPRSVIEFEIDEVYFQCARAIVRSELWNPEKYIDPSVLPTPGQILAKLSDDRVGGADYDRKWPDRAQKSLW